MDKRLRSQLHLRRHRHLLALHPLRNANRVDRNLNLPRIRNHNDGRPFLRHIRLRNLRHPPPAPLRNHLQPTLHQRLTLLARTRATPPPTRRIRQIRHSPGNRQIHVSLRIHHAQLETLRRSLRNNLPTHPMHNRTKRNRLSPRLPLILPHVLSRRNARVDTLHRRRDDSIFRRRHKIRKRNATQHTHLRRKIQRTPARPNLYRRNDVGLRTQPQKNHPITPHHTPPHSRITRHITIHHPVRHRLGTTPPLRHDDRHTHLQRPQLTLQRLPVHSPVRTRLNSLLLFSRLHAQPSHATTPTSQNKRTPRTRRRPRRSRIQRTPKRNSNRLRRTPRKRIPQRNTNKTQIRTRTRHRLHLLHRRRRRRIPRLSHRTPTLPRPNTPTNVSRRTTILQIRTRVRILRRRNIPLPRIHKRRNGTRTHPRNRNPTTILQLRRLIPVGIHTPPIHLPSHRRRQKPNTTIKPHITHINKKKHPDNILLKIWKQIKQAVLLQPTEQP